MKFSEVVGHHDLKKKLITSVNTKRIPHAQLFLGNQGSGNLALCIAYAQYIACTNKQEGDSCGECSSCKKYQILQHPDLHFAMPIVGSDKNSDHFVKDFKEAILSNPYITYEDWMSKISDDKSGIINVAQANEIVRKLGMRPYESDYQVMIIWMPECLHVSASNKLLKTIEEPTKNTLIFLVANNDEELLNTIKSRVQYVKLKKINDMDMLEKITSSSSISLDKAREIVNVVDGDVNYAMHLVEMGDVANEYNPLLQSWLRNSFLLNLEPLQKDIDAISKLGRDHQIGFYEYCMHIIRESMMFNNAENIMRVTNNEKLFLEKFKTTIRNEKVPRLIKRFEEAIYHVNRNGNAKLIAMNLSMDMHQILKIEA